MGNKGSYVAKNMKLQNAVELLDVIGLSVTRVDLPTYSCTVKT